VRCVWLRFERRSTVCNHVWSTALTSKNPVQKTNISRTSALVVGCSSQGGSLSKRRYCVTLHSYGQPNSDHQSD
jgi:hypothetical protein